ncbi:MAG: hypothetical protein ACJ749_19300 [Flavisolibacter sp.]
MKKLFVLLSFFTVLFISRADAQGQGGDPAARQAKMKETLKPQLIEKTKLTDAQAEKVFELYFKSRSEMRGFRDLTEDERTKKRQEIQVVLDKAYKDIPLTDDQVKAVDDFFEAQRQEMMKQRQNGGGGNN